MKYSAKLDLSAKVITVLVLCVIASVSFLIFSFEPEQPTSWFKWLSYPIAILLLSIPLIVFLYAPTSYEVSDEDFIVHRIISDITIPIKDILGVDNINDSFVRDLERRGGNGGAFGYFGEFSAGRDTYHLYCTKMKGTVLILTKDDKLIVSPEDHGLVKVLRGMIQPIDAA